MKLLSKIVWSEGMYLAPHHFQAQTRYFEDSIHFAVSNLWPHSYGFADIQLDADALRNGTVALLHARGLFEDGLAFDMPESDPLPEPRNIIGAFPLTADQLTVYLAIHCLTSEGQNCELESLTHAAVRYVGYIHELHDENTGRDQKPVRLGRKNIQLVLESEITDELVTLPIARVVRDGQGHFAFDSRFIPTCLKISASERLFDILRRLVEILEEKSTAGSQGMLSSGRFKTGMSAPQVSHFWFLHAINSSLSPLRHMLSSKHEHPEEMFREMLRLGGALCTFDLETHPRSLPAYDHKHLDQCFQQLDDDIRRLLEVVIPSRAISIRLKQVDRYFYEGVVKDQRCFDQARWIFGIHAPIGEADLIIKTQKFVKICSAKFVPELVKRALPGVVLTHLPVAPAAIAAKVEYQYFSISRSGPCWEHIMRSKAVGVYVPGDLPTPEMDFTVILEA